MYLARGYKPVQRDSAYEIVDKVGLPAFGLFMGLLLSTDDIGVLRFDPRRIMLLTGATRRDLRRLLPKLEEAGLVRPFIVPGDRQPGRYAPEVTTINAPGAKKVNLFGHTDGKIGDWNVHLWIKNGVNLNTTRAKRAVIMLPRCPASWLREAKLDEICQLLVKKSFPEIEIETEIETEHEIHDHESRSHSRGREATASPPSGSNQKDIRENETETEHETGIDFARFVADIDNPEWQRQLLDAIATFLDPDELIDFQAIGELPERLRDQVRELKAMYSEWEPQQRIFMAQLRAFLKHRHGQQQSWSLLQSLCDKQMQRIENNFD
jgi:hypothetical protein